MNSSLAEAVSVVLLLLVLACAVIRPFGWPEAVVAVPAAGVVIATRAISLDHARDEAVRLGPVIGFLAAVLVLAHLCDQEGLFQACGAWMARSAAGRPHRLLLHVFAAASVITAVLSLDATIVLLTPVVFATAARLGARPKPHVYACTHLSNTASLLLPVSNLTNLLAFAASGLSFTRFAALMALPWLVAIAVEYGVFRRFFAADLDAGAQAPAVAQPPEPPVFALVTVACTLAGFVLTSALGVDPAWAAFMRRRRARRAGAGPAPHHTRRDPARRFRAVPRLRPGAGHRGARGRRPRASRRTGPPDPGRHRARCPDRYRRIGRRAGQHHQQSARRTGALAADRAVRAYRSAGRVVGGEHRPQPHLRRLPWPPSCGGASSTSTTARSNWASSPDSACSPCPSRSCCPSWHCGPRWP